MKKLNIYSTVALGLLTLGLNAQTVNPFVKKGQPIDPALNKAAPTDKKSLSKSEVNEWYSPYDFGIGAINTFATFLLNDSVKFGSSSSDVITYNGTDAAVLQVLDPKDDKIALSETPMIQLSRYSDYKVDSVRMNYIYVRPIDSVIVNGQEEQVVDTLFISYFKGSQILTTGRFGGTVLNNVKFGTVGWNFATQFPANYLKTDTILLSDNARETGVSATGWGIRPISFAAPANMSIDADGSGKNDLVAFSVRFKHGLAFDSTYWLEDRRTNPVPNIKKVNYFGYQIGQPTIGPELNVNFYNSAATVPPRYAFASTNGWTGWYPNYGVESQTDLAYPIMEFLMTSTNVGLNEVKNAAFGMTNVYPNPAKSSDKTVIGFTLKTDATVSVSVINLVGQEVKAGFNKSFQAGTHAEFVDMNGLKAGVYFVTMTVNGSSISKKLTITE